MGFGASAPAANAFGGAAGFGGMGGGMGLMGGAGASVSVQPSKDPFADLLKI